jgi:hypothetical protein
MIHEKRGRKSRARLPLMQILQGKYCGLRVLRELKPHHQVKSERKEREYVVMILYMIQDRLLTEPEFLNF